MIKALFVDIDNTILDFNKCELEALKPVLREYNILPTPEVVALYSRINLSYWKMLEKKQITRTECVTLRWNDFFSHFNIEVDAQLINKKYFEILKNGSYLMDGAIDFLKEVKRLNMSIYALTNGSLEVQNSRLEKSGVLKYLDKVYISEQIGYTKPDKRFFDYVLKDNNLSSNEVIMLGDSLSSDIIGAINASIKPIWLDLNHANIKGDYLIVNDLKEALALIKEESNI